MKFLAALVVMGLCLLAGTPPDRAHTLGERKGACYNTDGQGGRMSCQMNSPVHACTCTANAASPGPFPYQNCNGTCSPATVISVQTTGVVSRIRRYSLHGYRRISGKNILDHTTRSRIYECIVLSPGIDLKTVAMMTGMNENTIRYHLDLMEKAGKILITTIGGASHFFENHGRYSADEQILKARMFSVSTSRILQMIEAQPGLSRGELADSLGIAGPSVTRAVRHLTEDGLIRLSREGRFTRYYRGWVNRTFPEEHLHA